MLSSFITKAKNYTLNSLLFIGLVIGGIFLIIILSYTATLWLLTTAKAVNPDQIDLKIKTIKTSPTLSLEISGRIKEEEKYVKNVYFVRNSCGMLLKVTDTRFPFFTYQNKRSTTFSKIVQPDSNKICYGNPPQVIWENKEKYPLKK